MPFAKYKEVKRHVQEMLDLGIIRPSNSPWAAPVHLVPKKDGSTRLVVNYRGINAVTRKDAYPIPRMDDLLNNISKCKVMTSIDCWRGYFQVPMHPDSVERTAFITPFALYEFLVTPFGLTAAPATFQRLVNQALHEYVGDFCFVYLDDILIFSESNEDHFRHVHLVFEALRSIGLRINGFKSKFWQTELTWLGFKLTSIGLQPDSRLVEVINNRAPPTTKKEAQSFLGMAGFFRRFVFNYSSIAAPITSLVGKNAKFEWGPEQQAAFEELKRRLTSAPVLRRADHNKQFTVWCDSSTRAIASILTQDDEETGKPYVIGYHSRKLTPTQQRWTITELECYAVVDAVTRHWSDFLLGAAEPFKIITDHVALKYLMTCKTLTSSKLARLQPTAVVLQPIQFGTPQALLARPHAMPLTLQGTVTTQRRRKCYTPIRIKPTVSELFKHRTLHYRGGYRPADSADSMSGSRLVFDINGPSSLDSKTIFIPSSSCKPRHTADLTTLDAYGSVVKTLARAICVSDSAHDIMSHETSNKVILVDLPNNDFWIQNNITPAEGKANYCYEELQRFITPGALDMATCAELPQLAAKQLRRIDQALKQHDLSDQEARPRTTEAYSALGELPFSNFQPQPKPTMIYQHENQQSFKVSVETPGVLARGSDIIRDAVIVDHQQNKLSPDLNPGQSVLVSFSTLHHWATVKGSTTASLALLKYFGKVTPPCAKVSPDPSTSVLVPFPGLNTTFNAPFEKMYNVSLVNHMISTYALLQHDLPLLAKSRPDFQAALHLSLQAAKAQTQVLTAHLPLPEENNPPGSISFAGAMPLGSAMAFSSTSKAQASKWVEIEIGSGTLATPPAAAAAPTSAQFGTLSLGNKRPADSAPGSPAKRTASSSPSCSESSDPSYSREGAPEPESPGST
eukprot:gene10619-10777_t